MTTLPRVLSIASLLIAWLILSAVFPPTIVPGPVPVFKAMGRNIASGQAFYHLYKTLLRVGLGLILTMVLGIAVGTIMGLSPTGESFLDSWVMVGLTVPAIVYSIVCLLWFGLNEMAAIIAIGTAAFPAVSISIWQGIKGMDMQLVGMGQAFHLSKSAIIRKIIFPQLIPHILASMRYALGICWKICTTVELIGMSSGVGFELNYWFGLFSMSQVFAWTLLFLLVMFAIEYLIFKPIEQRLTRWRSGVPAIQWAQ
ncbi:MAG TPA: ABC transporter permease subunit [Terriglobia bacterium]